MTQEQKAKAYDEAIKVANKYKDIHIMFPQIKDEIFPELKESEDEKVRKDILDCIKYMKANYCFPSKYTSKQYDTWISWLEKQGEQKDAFPIPTRENILAIWDLGNEWKELTNGCISTEHGTQLDYIQKHWHESEHYLKEKQGEQKPITSLDMEPEVLDKVVNDCIFGNEKSAWSEEDERLCQCLIEDQKEALDNVNNDKYGHSEIISDLKEMYNERIDWLKSLKQRYTWKPSDEQMEALHDLNITGNISYAGQGQTLIELYNDLKKLREE